MRKFGCSAHHSSTRMLTLITRFARAAGCTVATIAVAAISWSAPARADEPKPPAGEQFKATTQAEIIRILDEENRELRRVKASDPAPTPAPSPAPVVPVAAATITPSGPVTLPALVTIDATASTGGTLIDVEADAASYQPDSSALKVYFSPPGPGKYTVTVDSMALDGAKVLRSRRKFTVEAVATKVDCPPVVPVPVVPTPTPGPVTPPAPAPVPVNPPVVGPFYAVLVWDQSQAEPRTDQIRVSNPPLTKQLKAIGCEWQVETTEQAADNHRTAQLAGVTLPTVLFIAPTGAVLGRMPTAATTTPADVVAKATAIKNGGN